MKNRLNTDVLIIGAGISGLASAHFLKKRGLKALILEKQERPGGSIRSERKDGFLVEYGPNSTLDTSPLIHEMFADLGIESQMEYANEQSKNRYIVRNSRLNALPMGAMAFLKTPHFSPAAKLRLLKEPFISPADPGADESLAAFVKRRLGQEFLDYAIDPFVAGVYAGKPDQLSVKSAFPKLHALEQKYGSLIKGTILGARERKKSGETSKQSASLFSFPDGMQTMIDKLAAEFRDELFLRAELRSVERENGRYLVSFTLDGEPYSVECGQMLMTIPAHSYEHLAPDFFRPLISYMEKMYHPPVSMVFFGFRKNPSPRPLDGFGFLIPSKENRQILGTIWSSTIFSGRAPQEGVALTTFVGGSRQPQNALLPEAEIIRLVREDLSGLMGIQEKPDISVVQQWPKAIPQYNVGHRQIIKALEQFERTRPGVYLSGNFRGGISVGDCIKQAETVAGQIAERVKRIQSQKTEIFH